MEFLAPSSIVRVICVLGIRYSEIGFTRNTNRYKRLMSIQRELFESRYLLDEVVDDGCEVIFAGRYIEELVLYTRYPNRVLKNSVDIWVCIVKPRLANGGAWDSHWEAETRNLRNTNRNTKYRCLDLDWHMPNCSSTKLNCSHCNCESLYELHVPAVHVTEEGSGGTYIDPDIDNALRTTIRKSPSRVSPNVNILYYGGSGYIWYRHATEGYTGIVDDELTISQSFGTMACRAEHQSYMRLRDTDAILYKLEKLDCLVTSEEHYGITTYNDDSELMIMYF
jgi:hypothetical protein